MDAGSSAVGVAVMSGSKGPQPDPGQRKDAAMVDRLLEGLFFGDDVSTAKPGQTPKPGQIRKPTMPSRPSTSGARPVASAKPLASARPSLGTPKVGRASENGRLGTWARIAIGCLVAGAMTQWPYAHACGFKLGLYLAAVGMVIVAGAWGGSFAWRNRLVLAHIVSQGLLVWGFVLGAGQVLPRVGYATEQATWGCSAPSQPILQERPQPASQGPVEPSAADVPPVEGKAGGATDAVPEGGRPVPRHDGAHTRTVTRS